MSFCNSMRWRLSYGLVLSGPQTAEQLVENILDEFEVEQAQAKGTSAEFLEQMLAHAHLEVCSKP